VKLGDFAEWRGFVHATRAVAALARGAAFIVCEAPLVLVLVPTAVGVDAAQPWRDWVCALPMSTTVHVCPILVSPDLPWG